jgi:hypothetical protein
MSCAKSVGVEDDEQRTKHGSAHCNNGPAGEVDTARNYDDSRTEREKAEQDRVPNNQFGGVRRIVKVSVAWVGDNSNDNYDQPGYDQLEFN